MDSIVTILTGSRAFGTDVPGSDTDTKGVHLPTGREILLQRANRWLPAGKGDPANGSSTLQDFLENACSGEATATEMLLSPPSLWRGPPTPAWSEVIGLAPAILTRRANFIDYAKGQATRQNQSARRMRTLLAVEAVLASRPGTRVSAVLEDMAALGLDEVSVLANPDRDNSMTLVVAGKSFPDHGHTSLALDAIRKMLARFGGRVRAAELNGCTDWKGTMHALRLAEQGQEYYSTGRLTFPRPNAGFLRQVRLGQVPLELVSMLLLAATERAEAAYEASSLSDTPDMAAVDDLVARLHGQQVMARFTADPAPGP